MKKIIRRLINFILNKINNSDVGLLNSSTREDWIIKQIEMLPKGSILLDAGAGLMPYKKYCTKLIYKSQDFGEYSGSGDGLGLQKDTFDTSPIDIISDITSIPLENASVDTILCSEVFEHIADPVKALKEFNRLLSPGGKLILTAPFNSITHFSPHFYATGFSNNYYQHHLTELGFKIIEIESNGNYFEYMAQELKRLPKVSKQNSSIKPNLVLEFSIRYLLRYLQRNSINDNGSNQLLCFGYHVLAEKS